MNSLYFQFFFNIMKYEQWISHAPKDVSIIEKLHVKFIKDNLGVHCKTSKLVVWQNLTDYHFGPKSHSRALDIGIAF